MFLSSTRKILIFAVIAKVGAIMVFNNNDEYLSHCRGKLDDLLSNNSNIVENDILSYIKNTCGSNCVGPLPIHISLYFSLSSCSNTNTNLSASVCGLANGSTTDVALDNSIASSLFCQNTLNAMIANKFILIGNPTPVPIPAKPSPPSPTVSTTPKAPSEPVPPPVDEINASLCYNAPGWKDADGDGCDWYLVFDWYCGEWGDLMGNKETGYTANQACCVCGGGFSPGNLTPSFSPSALPSIAPSPSNTINHNPTPVPVAIDLSASPTFEPIDEYYGTSCTDVPDWTDPMGSKCSKYEFWGACIHKTLQYIGSFGLKVSEACCVCGGGDRRESFPSASPTHFNGTYGEIVPTETSNTCIDLDWADKRGQNCTYYKHISHYCKNFGSSEWNEGQTPNTACCACEPTSFSSGGGVDSSKVIVKEFEPEEKYYGSPSSGMRGYDKCIDFPDWTDNSGSYNCTYFNTFSNPEHPEYLGFAKPNTKCESRGSLLSSYRISANEACCGCFGGSSGSLVNRRLRVGVPTGAESNFAMYVEPNGFINGSVPELLRFVAKATGFGLYETKLSKTSLSRFPTDMHAACLNDLELQNVDLCLGAFWQTGFGTYEPSAPLYTDIFFLVVPVYDETILSQLVTTFRVFSPLAWFVILMVVLYMALVMSIIQQGCKATSSPWNTRFFSVLYHGVKNFLTRSINNSERPGIPEKCVTMAFILFTMIVMTAYTGSLAASLSVSFNKVKYASLQDLIQADDVHVCIQERLYRMFLEQNPESKGTLVAKSVSQSQIISFMDDFNLETNKRTCEAVIVTGDVYYNYAANNADICGTKEILKGTPILQVDNSIMISQRFAQEEWGGTLLKMLGLVIERGYYQELHASHKKVQVVNDAVCATDTKEEYLVLTPLNLLGPIMISWVLTTSAILLYFLRRKKNLIQKVVGSVSSKVLDKLDSVSERISSMKKSSPSCNTSIAESTPSRSTTFDNSVDDNEEEELNKHLKTWSTNKLIDELVQNEFPSDEVKQAIDQLPDKKALIRLNFNMLCSDSARDRKLIRDLSLSELVFALRKVDEDLRIMKQEPYSSTFKSILDDSKDPKKRLVAFILADKNLLHAVMTVVKRYNSLSENASNSIHEYHIVA